MSFTHFDCDAAHVCWGGTWRMPTKAEQEELRNKCSWTWTTQNGVNGYKVVGRNGNSIFLPAAGRRWNDRFEDVSWQAVFWSSSLVSAAPFLALGLSFDWHTVTLSAISRSNGYSVRAVCP